MFIGMDKMGMNKHLLVAASFLGISACLPSAVPKTEIIIPGSEDTVQMIDKGYNAPPPIPPLSELVQEMYKECRSKMCEFHFPEESVGMSYLSISEGEKEYFEVMVFLYEDGEMSTISLMTDDQPFGSLDSVFLLKKNNADHDKNGFIMVNPDELAQFNLLYEKSILAGFTYNEKHGSIEKGLVSPQDVRKINQKLFDRYFVMPEKM